MSIEDRFWADTERAEEKFATDFDVATFRNRMKELGHDAAIIDERIADIHPALAKGTDHVD